MKHLLNPIKLKIVILLRKKNKKISSPLIDKNIKKLIKETKKEEKKLKGRPQPIPTVKQEIMPKKKLIKLHLVGLEI